MPVSRDAILDSLARLTLPDGGDPVSRDMVRALRVEGGAVRFVLEAVRRRACNAPGLE